MPRFFAFTFTVTCSAPTSSMVKGFMSCPLTTLLKALQATCLTHTSSRISWRRTGQFGR